MYFGWLVPIQIHGPPVSEEKSRGGVDGVGGKEGVEEKLGGGEERETDGV